MKELILDNLGLKISAILIAIFLWLFVTSQGQSEIFFEIPIEFKNIPVGLGIASDGKKTVQVTIRGQELMIKNIQPSDVRVYVDLDNAKAGKDTYYIAKDDVKLPYAAKVMNVQPSSLQIRLDETISKIVTIKPTISGLPEKGFAVNAIHVEPATISVEGLRSEIMKIRELRTEPMDITGLQETISQSLNIDTRGANIKPEFNKVKVTAIIVKQ